MLLCNSSNRNAITRCWMQTSSEVMGSDKHPSFITCSCQAFPYGEERWLIPLMWGQHRHSVRAEIKEQWFLSLACNLTPLILYVSPAHPPSQGVPESTLVPRRRIMKTFLEHFMRSELCPNSTNVQHFFFRLSCPTTQIGLLSRWGRISNTLFSQASLVSWGEFPS